MAILAMKGKVVEGVFDRSMIAPSQLVLDETGRSEDQPGFREARFVQSLLRIEPG